VQIICNVVEADIYVDGHYRGEIQGYREGFIALPLGKRRLRIAQTGYYSRYFIVEVSQQATRIDVQLVPVPRFDEELPAGKTSLRGLN